MSETAPSPPSTKQASEITALVDRTIKRNIRGLGYFTSPAPVVGHSAKDLLYSRGTLNLYHYRPKAPEIYRTPILFVMATTNRSYILDVAPGMSFVEFFLDAGYDVFVMDWEPPVLDERRHSLATYADDFVSDCIDQIKFRTGEDEVTLMGYCMGGVLATVHTAANKGDRIRNLVCFTTPSDFHAMGLFSSWTDEKYFDVDRLVDAVGIVPADMVMQAFLAQQPAKRPVGQMHLYDQLWNDQFVSHFRRMDRWSNDVLPLAGEYFRDTVKELMWANKLVKGGLEIKGKKADLNNIDVPFFHAVAQYDSIVPREASAPLAQLISSKDKTEVVLKGGHISLLAGASAKNRLWIPLDQWLSERSQ